VSTKWPTSSIARPSTIYPNGDFGFENVPSGNPDRLLFYSKVILSLDKMNQGCQIFLDTIYQNGKMTTKYTKMFIKQMALNGHNM
jgi:hypothetical protein